MNSRALSQTAAWRCEQALEPRCRCRCNGLLHGARRVAEPDHLVTEIPAGDPHHVTPEPDPLEHVKHPAWLRRVRSVRKEHARYGPAWAKRLRIILECRHVVLRKSSRGVPRRVHCVACFTAAQKAVMSSM
jgi:hypothetical protein